jgi:hypothetical protein
MSVPYFVFLSLVAKVCDAINPSAVVAEEPSRAEPTAARSPEAKAGAARDAVASVAVTLTFRHLLLYGSHPPERTVERWIEKLKGLSDTEVLEIGASEEAQVRFLRSRG